MQLLNKRHLSKRAFTASPRNLLISRVRTKNVFVPFALSFQLRVVFGERQILFSLPRHQCGISTSKWFVAQLIAAQPDQPSQQSRAYELATTCFAFPGALNPSRLATAAASTRECTFNFDRTADT